MADEITGIVPRETTDLAGDSSPEPIEPKTVKEIISEFAQRRHRITVFQHARILFDPKQLPGVTPKEAMEFLLKGLRIEEPEVREKLLGKAGTEIKLYFEDFIESLKQQNNAATVADIWEARDADAIKKMALQWEIQTKHQLIEESIEESAERTATNLRRLDALLKEAGKGTEVFVRLRSVKADFNGLVIADGEGLDFVRNPNNVPYRNIVFGGQAAFSVDYDPIQKSDGLIIPFEAREALGIEKEKYWRDKLNDNGFYKRKDNKFDPKNNFPSVVMGTELSEMVKGTISDPSTEAYDKLAKVLKEPQKSISD